jgi:hypothetical protein
MIKVAVNKHTMAPVPTRNASLKLNQSVIARWDEDGVWYNAIIKSVEEETKYKVIFKEPSLFSHTLTLQSANILLMHPKMRNKFWCYCSINIGLRSMNDY